MNDLARTTFRAAWLTLLPGLLLATACGDDPVPPPAKSPAKILSFTSDRSTVPSGTRVTLSWSVQDATSVTIRSPTAVLVDASAELTGSVMTAELTAQTVYTILATSEGGNAMSSLTINIAAANAVQVSTFEASSMTVSPGTAVTLTWTTMNATSVTLTQMGNATPIVNASTTRLDSSETVTPNATATYVLRAEGAAGTSAMRSVTITVEGTPVITAFTAMPQAIELGASSTLSWNVTGASMITIANAAGMNVYSGSMGMGTQAVSPTVSSTYTLTAVSALNQTVMSLPVMVTVNRAARVISFTANPTAIDFGDTSELRWEVARAPGGITISDGNSNIVTSSAAMGAFTVTATVNTTYTLNAINTDGNTTAMATLSVNPVAPRISLFEATPNPARIGEMSTIAWATAGATSVRVVDPSGSAVYTGAEANGTVMVAVTATRAMYTLETTNPNGGTNSTLDLVGQRDPIISTFAATPGFYIAPSTTATVTWSTVDALSTTLTINGVAAAGFAGTATGSYTFTTTVTARLVLTAINDVSQSTREAAVLRLVDATVDAGNTFDTATSVDGSPGAVGAIGPTGGTGGDLDWYTVTVAEGGNLTIETSDGSGACPFDTYVSLFGPDGTTLLGFDDDDGVPTCSLINPTRDAFARNLAAGTYYIQVRGFGAASTGQYVITVVANPGACGNSLTETRLSEQCDDGNSASGDGCSATCQVEPTAVVMGPGVTQSLAGSITPVGNADFVRIDMLADGYIGAEVFIPARGRCDASTGSADPLLVLYDANFVELGRDDADGIASCSRIDPTFDTFAAVPAGTYYLRITEDGDNAVINAYILDIRTIGQGCGNALLEGAEECDDGNAVNGDGCSLTCLFEGLAEVEPNDTFATGTVIVPPANSFIVRGSITPIADNDFYLIDVPAGYHLDAYITVNSLDSCSDDPEGNVALYNPAGTLQTSNTTGGPQGNCGRIWPYTTATARALTGGRWGIRVIETGDNAAINVYFLHVNLIPPGCGNTIIEGTEQCEDGNTVDGDGCSATCGFEPVATVNLSALGTSTISGVISPEYNRDAIRLTVSTSSVYVRAETFVDAASASCVGTTTRLVLFDDSGTELGSDTIDGVASCSLIDPQFDPFALLGPGNYWLVVEESGNNATIPTYDVVVRGITPNVCGNGIIEDALGEECDGQSFCSATCTIIPVAVLNGPPASMTYTDSIAVVGELDFYRIELASDAYLYAETGEPTIGACSADTVLRVFSAATGAQVAVDDEGGIGSCSLLSATLLTAGTYYVRVEEYLNNGTIATYQLALGLSLPNTCGNGVTEAGETCDDRNTNNGDGCSSVCLVEPQGTHTGPGTPVSVFTNSIGVVGEIDEFEIVVTQTSYLRAETFAPTSGVCPTGNDTIIRLRDSTGAIVGIDDDDGIGNCSLITATTDTFARLTPGTYFLAVEEYLNDGTLAAYVLEIGLVAADVCGNGVREGAESCDDGNTAGGDGCSAVCALEPDGMVNGPTGGVTSFNAAIETVGDNDVFSIVLSQPSLVRIDVADPTSAACAISTFTPALTLISANNSVIETDTVDGPGACSLIGRRVMPAGSYTVRVEENGNNAILTAYTLNIETIALTAINGTYSGPGASQLFAGALDTLGDVDVYGLTLTAPGRVLLETGTLLPTCASAATVVRVYSTDGYELAFDNFDGVGSCSLYDAADQLDLPAGSYFVTVEESGRNSLVATYDMSVGVTAIPAAVCGSGYRELGEACDDGNTTAGDGCSATCTLEDVSIISENNVNNSFAAAQNLGTIAPGSVVNVSATMREGSADWFSFTLAGSANVRVNTYGTAGMILTSCTGDTVMSLYSGEPGDPLLTTSATQPTLVEYDDDDGFGACSFISGTEVAPARRALTAGTYWVQVRRFSNNTAIGQYYLNVDVAP